MKLFLSLIIMISFPMISFAGFKCKDLQQELGKQTALYKLVASQRLTAKVFKAEGEKVDSEIFDVFMNQQCRDSKKQIQTARVLFKVNTWNEYSQNYNYYYCYTRANKSLVTKVWKKVETTCEITRGNVIVSYESSTPFPYGGAEDPFYNNGDFYGSPDEIYDPLYPSREDYNRGHNSSPDSLSNDPRDPTESGGGFMGPDGSVLSGEDSYFND